MALECPRCARPVAVARRQCLYCGAGLSAPVVATPRPASAARPVPVAEPPRSDRVLVIAALSGADPARLAAAFGLSAYEAGQWARRGGYQLHRSSAPAEAEAERERLTAQGIVAYTCPEAEARTAAEPEPVSGGGFDGAALRLRTPAGPLALAAADLLLVVKGAITREHPIKDNSGYSAARRNALSKVPMATLEPGFRFHLHRHDHPRPVEIDPGEFDFGAARAGESSLLELAGWIAALAATVPVDDGFRRMAPALAPVVAAPGAARLEDALRAGPSSPPAILDNLAQFRFYSAWRGAVERQARRR